MLLCLKSKKVSFYTNSNFLIALFFQPEAEFKELEPRLKFKPLVKYYWFHLKLYSMLQDLSGRSIATGFFCGFKTGLKFIKFGHCTLDISILVTHCILYILIIQGYPQRMTLHYQEDLWLLNYDVFKVIQVTAWTRVNLNSNRTVPWYRP